MLATRHDGMDAQDKYVKLIHGIKNVPNFITKKLGGPYHGRLYNNRNRFGKDKISYLSLIHISLKEIEIQSSTVIEQEENSDVDEEMSLIQKIKKFFSFD